MFHLHKWTKWESFEKLTTEHFHPLERMNWYAKTVTTREDWEKRKCKLCGKTQQRRIS